MLKRTRNGIAFAASGWPPDPARPTLLFIHGAGGSHHLWQAQIDALAPRANTIAIDLPGHGDSTGEGLRRIEDYAAAVADFIRVAGAPNPVPCGLSMGGAITQQLLLDQKEAFRAAILVSTGARLRVMPVILKTIEENYDAYLESFVSFAASPKTDPARLKPLLEAAARCSPRVALGDFEACDAFDVMDQISSIKTPVLVITAEDDRLTPPKYGTFLEKRIKSAYRVHIPDAGHLVPMEKPEAVNRAIVEFLDRIGL